MRLDWYTLAVLNVFTVKYRCIIVWLNLVDGIYSHPGKVSTNYLKGVIIIATMHKRWTWLSNLNLVPLIKMTSSEHWTAVSWLNLTKVENPFRAKVDYFKETLEILLKFKNLHESAFNKMIQPCSCIELSCRAILTSSYLFLFGDLKNVVVPVGL